MSLKKHPMLPAVVITALVGVAVIVGNSLLTGHILQTGIERAVRVPLPNDLSATTDERLLLMRAQEGGGTVIVEYPGEDSALSQTETTTGGVPDTVETAPGPNAIPREKALSLARDAVAETYDLRPELFERFTITAKHQSNGEQAFWWVSYYPADSADFMEIGCYNVWLNASVGEPVQISSAADGLG